MQLHSVNFPPKNLILPLIGCRKEMLAVESHLLKNKSIEIKEIIFNIRIIRKLK